MTRRAKFDLARSPLATGTTLIEASAGTGKTYAIAGIVLRLVLEEGLGIEQILVSTYTELATAEVRDRIRKLLRKTLVSIESAVLPADELIAALAGRYLRESKAASRLRLALENFDQAPISTIHGFCRRMLKEYAFESGGLFDAELVTDQDPILREIVDDFWRTHFYSGEPIVTTFALRNKLTPEKLLNDIRELVNKPTLKVMPQSSKSLAECEREFVALWEKLRACWQACAEEVRAIFTKPTWAKLPYNDRKTTEGLLANLSQCLSGSTTAVEQLECLRKFTPERLAKGTSAKSTPPAHQLFDYCRELLAAEKGLIVRLEAAFFSWARAEMKRRKVQRNVLSFDDLLTRLDDSLGGEGGSRLAGTIRERFPAALIDEFQDTDPIQYSIFRRIYGGSNTTRLFFIGDPKQAIYGFRGADVFTYIAAAKAAEHSFTLGKNWRSESGLVQATNRLFGLRDDAFVLEGIPFEAVTAAGKADATPFVMGRSKPPAFQLWLAKDETPLKNREAEQLLANTIAAEITRLLDGGAKLGANPVEARDIAVLVATNAEAQLIQETLRSWQIPNVIYSGANVFKSHEAVELARILAAVAEPGQERLVRAALATDALGLTGEGLEALRGDERAWELRLLQFQKYHQLWRQQGFIQMLRTLVLEENVRGRLLRYFDGERRLTNMLHLAELLHQICGESRLGVTGLLKRLREEISTAGKGHAEEYELRLEQDEHAVRVVTVHKSKGLQFGIVFCPFTWSGFAPKDRGITFHCEDELVLDLEKQEDNKQKHLRETLADNVRRMYVAVTRAEHRCYLVWGNFKSGPGSAPAHLLGDWPSKPALAELSSEKAIAIAPLPASQAEMRLPITDNLPNLTARVFQRTLDRSYGIASFSRLISDRQPEPESPEEDSIALPSEEEPPEIATPLSGMFAFPRGTGPGTCLHHILEEIDFADLSTMPEIVRQKLRAFGIDGFDAAVCEMVERTVAASLDSKGPAFTLAQIRKDARLSELEFHFPIGQLRNDALAKVMGDARLQFHPMSGFMKGYIDLIFQHAGKFYIADWKSNWLGPEPAAYSAEAMEAEMVRSFYHLQLSIYTVALHRFLRSRLPGYSYEKHFGGVYYFFLRGIHPALPDCGIYRTRPSCELIEALDAIQHND